MDWLYKNKVCAIDHFFMLVFKCLEYLKWQKISICKSDFFLPFAVYFLFPCGYPLATILLALA